MKFPISELNHESWVLPKIWNLKITVFNIKSEFFYSQMKIFLRTNIKCLKRWNSKLTFDREEIENLQNNFSNLSKKEKYSTSTLLGEYFLENSDFQKGKVYFLKSYSLSQEENEQGLHSRTLIGLTNLYIKLKDLKEGEIYANLLKKEAPRILFPKIRTKAYLTLGRFYREKQEYKTSIKFYYESLELEQDEKEKLEIQYEIGCFLLERKDYENARSYFNYGLKDSLIKYFDLLELKFLYGLARIKMLNNRKPSYDMLEEVISRAEPLDPKFFKEVVEFYELEKVKEKIESNYSRFLVISDEKVKEIIINDLYESIISLKSHDFDEELYLKITNYLFDKKRFEQAEKMLQITQKVAELKNSNKYQIDILQLWAMIKYFTKEFDISMEFIDKILKMEKIPFDAIVNMKIFKINILFYYHDYERAKTTCQELKQIGEIENNLQVQALSFHKLGCIEIMMNELQKAEENLKIALNFIKNSQTNLESSIQSDIQFLTLVMKLKKSKKIESQDVENLIYYLFTADYEHALVLFNKIYHLLTKSFLKIQALYQMIIIHKVHLPDPEREKESLKKAMKLIDSVSKKDLVDSEMIQLIIAFNSSILVKEGKYEESNKILLNLIDSIQIQDLELLKLIYYQIGINYSTIGKTENAIEYYQKTLEVSKEDVPFNIEVLLNLGHLNKKNRLKMDEYYRDALQLARENDLIEKEKQIEKLLEF